MFHVYVIVSESHPERYYMGFSSRPDERLTEHNARRNPQPPILSPGVSPQCSFFLAKNKLADSSASS